ncbi:MAG TPA: helix-turn-helix transcriptional regulator [Patescibacteria group bacterium]|nr:helix-turn-helix transcriptional regulator [Patescibacteria group bacterium]
MKNKYGSVIKRERENRGLKAGYVAVKLGVSAGTYSQIELGKRGLSDQRLSQILGVLGMTLADLEEKSLAAEKAAS